MSESTACKWDALSFAALSERYEGLVRGIGEDLAALATLGPALQLKAKDVGLTIELDYSALTAAVAALAPGKRGRGARDGAKRRGATPGRPHKFLLVWKKGSKPVVDESGVELRFRNQVKMLRGPKYERIIGAKVGDVQLVDTEDDDKVVESVMTLGPAPGGRRPRG